jgi:hypothetical protein
MLSVNPTTMDSVDIHILKMKINRVSQCIHFVEIYFSSFENHDAGSQANQKGCRT